MADFWSRFVWAQDAMYSPARAPLARLGHGPDHVQRVFWEEIVRTKYPCLIAPIAGAGSYQHLADQRQTAGGLPRSAADVRTGVMCSISVGDLQRWVRIQFRPGMPTLRRSAWLA